MTGAEGRYSGDPDVRADCWSVTRASAGSGKTYRLIRRLMSLYKYERNTTSFMAVTFTNKAAAEMKARFLAAARDLVCGNESRLGTEAGIEIGSRLASSMYWDILDNYSRLNVSTIHSFCNSIVSRFALDCGLPLRPRVLDSVESGRLKDSVLSEFMEDLVASRLTPQESSAIAVVKSTRSGMKDLLKLIQESVEFANMYREWLSSTGKVLANEDPDPLLADWDNLAGAVLVGTQALVNVSGDACGSLLGSERGRLLFGDLATELSSTGSRAVKARDLATRLNGLLGGASVDPLLSVLVDLESQVAARSARTTKWVIKMQDEGGSLWAARRLWLPVLRNATLPRIGAMSVLVVAYMRRYALLKRRLGVMDFADMEWFASRMLRSEGDGFSNADYVLFCLSQRVRHLAVDEFQDTSLLQWEILGNLAELVGGPDVSSQGSVFVVGDVKQSIYRFRHAEPELMDVAATRLRDLALGCGREFHELVLDRSFRSTPAVLEAVEAVFSRERQLLVPGGQAFMSLPEGEQVSALGSRSGSDSGSYGEVLVEPLFASLMRVEEDESDDGNGRETGGVLVTPVQRGASGAESEAVTGLERCAEWLAGTIRELVGKREPVFDKLLPGYRPVRYGDILVLFRSRTHAPEFERAMRRSGIPFLSVGGGTMATRPEYQDLLAVVRFVLRPSDDVALASVLRSPLFRVDEAELLVLSERRRVLSGPGAGRTSGKELGRRVSLWSALSEESGSVDLPVVLREAFGHLEDLRGFWRRRPSELLTHLETAFSWSSLYRQSLGHGAEANIQKYWKQAIRLETRGAGTLERFGVELERLGDVSDFTDAPVPPSDGAGMVQCMTIHGAKGLEAPVVFLPDSGPVMGQRPDSGFVCGKEAATRGVTFVVPRLSDDPIAAVAPELELEAGFDPVQVALADERRRERAEQACLHYVALTRARDRLYIGGFSNRAVLAESGSDDEAVDTEEALANRARPECLVDDMWDALHWLRETRGAQVEMERAGNNTFTVRASRLRLVSGQKPIPAEAPVSSGRLGLSEPVEGLSPMMDKDVVSGEVWAAGRHVAQSRRVESGANIDWRELVASRAVGDKSVNIGANSRPNPVDGVHVAGQSGRFGSAVHAVLEMVSGCNGELRESEALSVAGRYVGEDEAVRVVGQVSGLLVRPETRQLVMARGLSEVPLVAALGNRTAVYGIPDKIAVMDNEVVIIDYKTHAPPAGRLEYIETRYAPQLRTYKQLLEAILQQTEKKRDIKMAIVWTSCAEVDFFP